MRILFLCKRRGPYKCGTFGLHNSAKFVARELSPGTVADVVTVVDANCIDREVAVFKPNLVILEAIWVTPAKLQELVKLHSTVQWIVRIHSKAAFLAQEGIAFQWMNEYVQIPNVRVSANNKEFNDDLVKVGYPAVYLPNVYKAPATSDELKITSQGARGFVASCTSSSLVAFRSSLPPIHIGCFGALRTMKNHVGQAIAAIHFADRIGRQLFFHINVETDGQAENVLKNLRGVFGGPHQHHLVEHPWLPHDEFCRLASLMDIGLQVSLSESFNIVTADFVHAGVPVVASKEVKHVHWLFRCHNVTGEIVAALHRAWWLRGAWLNRRLLDKSNDEAMRVWERFLRA